MIKAILLVFGIGAVSFLQLKKPISKQGLKAIRKEVTVYLSIVFFTCVIGVLMIMGKKPPSPVLPFEAIFEKIGKAILKP